MQSGNRLFDDMARLMTNAFGVAQDARQELESAFTSWFDRMIAQRNFITREEFEAVSEMARIAREENKDLRERLDKLEAKMSEIPEDKT